MWEVLGRIVLHSRAPEAEPGAGPWLAPTPFGVSPEPSDSFTMRA